MTSSLSVADQLRQLNDARKLVLGDIKYYPSVVKGILQIIGPSATIELRLWGAEFLAEAFATPALPNAEKETMQPYVLGTLSSMLENDREDPQVLRTVIQTAASIYSLALRWIINNGYDTITWEKIVDIKQRILQLWNHAVPSVRICCIKFAQRVILAQSIATGDLRYGGTLDVSLDKIPPNHQTLVAQNLEAEAMGLLDRMLSVLQDSGDALIVDATLNCLSILVRTRPATSNRILNAVLNFDPLKFAQSPLTSKSKVVVRSMEKTSRMLLLHLSKRDPLNPMVPQIHKHVERTMRLVAEAFDATSKKRGFEAPKDVAVDSKRQKTAVPEPQIQPLGPGPHTLADVFSLTDAPGLKTFDLSQVPSPLIAKLAVSILSKIEPSLLTKSIEAVHSRLHNLSSMATEEVNPDTAPLGVDDDDDDDYEPDYYQAEDTEQILNKLDSAPTTTTVLASIDSGLELKSFSLSQPQVLTPTMALSAGNGIVERVVDMMKTTDEPVGKRQKAGFSRLAASSGIKESWVTILTRLATRASAGLGDSVVKDEGETKVSSNSLSNAVRDSLYSYIMEDFRKNIDVAVSWLCEEWYNDRLQGSGYVAHYQQCVLRLIDGFLPYLHPQDKVLTRFLSEIPELNREILSRVKTLCRDPSVVDLALRSLLYLVLMRPPVKEIALDTVQDIWTDYEDARHMAAKYLSKYRPAFLQTASQNIAAS